MHPERVYYHPATWAGGDAAKLSDYRAAAPKGTTAEVSVYLGSALFLPPHSTMPLTPGIRTFARLAAGPNFADIALSPDEPIGPWQHALIDVNVNGYLFGSSKPVAWWAGEPTDWISGIARWEWPPFAGEDGLPGMHVTVGIRRPR